MAGRRYQQKPGHCARIDILHAKVHFVNLHFSCKFVALWFSFGLCASMESWELSLRTRACQPPGAGPNAYRRMELVFGAIVGGTSLMTGLSEARRAETDCVIHFVDLASVLREHPGSLLRAVHGRNRSRHCGDQPCPGFASWRPSAGTRRVRD